MSESKQLTIPETPKSRGGYRPGAGRKKTAPDTVTIRVCEAVAEDCKAISAAYRREYDRCRALGIPMSENLSISRLLSQESNMVEE